VEDDVSLVGDMPKIALHAGHAEPELNFGILVDVPIVWLALTAWRVRKRKNGLAFLASLVLWIAVAQIGLLMLFFRSGESLRGRIAHAAALARDDRVARR